jgi:hypothetical protein
MTTTIAGIHIPDSAMARAATELVRDTEPDLLYNHSRRVFLFGALTGERRQLKPTTRSCFTSARCSMTWA